MKEMSKHGQIGKAALRSGMDRKTARKYLAQDSTSPEPQRGRDWRTRPDSFEQDWAMIERMLKEAPTLEAKTIFEFLQSENPGRYQDGQLRTLQRQIKQWRASEGPPKEVYFTQDHRPGEAMQTDYTNANKLRITIKGERFDHLICHSVLPFSNWESATVSHSESLSSLKRGMQSAVFRLGRVPQKHQTDNSTAATHRESKSKKKRVFNTEYLEACQHLGFQPCTTSVGAKEQNGDIEVSNRVLKNRLEQHLLVRGHRDFESVESYESWLWQDCQRANKGRTKRLGEELRVMNSLPSSRLAEYQEIEARVTSASTIRINKNAYSVASRLIGEKVRVRLFDTRIEVYYGGLFQFETGRLHGRAKHDINYRHIIDSLVRKPGAFARYRYREDLFPSLEFRRAYDSLCQTKNERQADLNYLRLLKLASDTSEALVEEAIIQIIVAQKLPSIEAVERYLETKSNSVPEVEEPIVNLEGYDDLLDSKLGMAS